MDRRAVAKELRVGVPLWYTVPEALDFGRVVVVEMLMPDGRVARYSVVINRFELVHTTYLNAIIKGCVGSLKHAINITI